MQTNNPFYQNNFNLIRLFASLQVAHYHLVSIFQLDITDAHRLGVKFLGFFPGVPIFFFISGFLISKSWESSNTWRDYAIKRIARIEPALIVSIIFALLLTYMSGYLSNVHYNFLDIVAVFLAKTTLLQFYNPDFLRGYGDGVLNGSIWTICVEIQFYILLPLCYLLIFKNNRVSTVVLFFTFILISLIVTTIQADSPQAITSKLLSVSFLPWYYMFLLGVVFQKYFFIFHRLLNGKFFMLLPIYLIACFAGLKLDLDFGNAFNPILFLLLAALIFSAAYSYTKTADTLLRGTDISYGVYLYHMPVINYFIFSGFSNSYASASFIVFLIISVSLMSWFIIEKPSLNYSKILSNKLSYNRGDAR